ncbi:hypothetical protein FE391_42590 [Nonomuraea sp. KC401]|uniref:tyrosine-type recombinase/integrase n=1 Tax=unclassified Nonomuraea TaxID=2593643 RepID=UPI0010FDFDEF|nr:MULTISPECIES: hypothetical protein [unclassified Nonomuraea]NBF00102.1 hypothetical protein [Nonomuraea sp. K271]TLF53947.1 hypothetical protein FE391_42590 [Nonomuraea sp. KC401]
MTTPSPYPIPPAGLHRNSIWHVDQIKIPVEVEVDGTLQQPWTVQIVDAATWGICGTVITPYPSERADVLAALRAALLRQDQYGPMGGIPALVCIDRGQNFMRTAVMDALSALNVHVEDLPAYRPGLRHVAEIIGAAVDETLLPSMPRYAYKAMLRGDRPPEWRTNAAPGSTSATCPITITKSCCATWRVTPRLGRPISCRTARDRAARTRSDAVTTTSIQERPDAARRHVPATLLATTSRCPEAEMAVDDAHRPLSPPRAANGPDHLRQQDFQALAHAHAATLLPAPGTAPPAYTVDELAQLLWRASPQVRLATVRWLSTGPLAPSTRQGYLRLLAWWLWWLNRQCAQPEDASVLQADLFAAAMRTAQWSPNARKQQLTALSSWYGHLHELGLTACNPFTGLRRPSAPPSRAELLSRDQLIDVAAQAALDGGARLHAVLMMVIATGCNADCLPRLTLQHVVRAGRDRIVDLAAAGGSHAVLLPPYAAQALDTYLTARGTEPGPLFVTRAGGPLPVDNANRQIRRIALAAGVQQAASLSIEVIRQSLTAAHGAQAGNRRARRTVPAVPGFAAPLYCSSEIRLCQRIATRVTRRRAQRAVEKRRSPLWRTS